MRPNFIFIIGGVLSGIGKGTTTASLAFILKSMGLKVTVLKIDPYVSIDAGTMRPAEHGEVFVTDDGGEIDQDLGNYERFLNQSLTKDHNITTGKVFRNVINNERHFVYKGRDAQMFPDIIDEIKRLLLLPVKDEDIVLVEVGGTTGDLENQPFLHAARELGRKYHSVYVLVTYLPFLKNVGELKTKPSQHAVASLREMGIFPNFIVTRGEVPIDTPRINTISARCFIDKEFIIDNPDTDNIYRIPLNLQKSNFAQKILNKLEIRYGKADLDPWKKFVNNCDVKGKPINIAIVGKYISHGKAEHKDVYISVYEALKHAAACLRKKITIIPIDSAKIEDRGVKVLKDVNPQALVVPQGWGKRGVKGIFQAIKYARENKIPYLGLCFGMQLSVIEFSRNILGLSQANSQEIDPKSPHQVIHIMKDQVKYLKKKQYGGTIRLGSWPCIVKKGSLLEKAYLSWGSGENSISGSRINERHRHRYEVNNLYLDKLAKAGFIVSGKSPDGKLVEAMELSKEIHPFFLGTQFHPEYKSRPLSPHPVFVSFVEAAGIPKRS